MSVPALRFPEFEGEWEEKRLGAIAKLTSSKRVYLSDYVAEGVPFFRGKEISELERGIIPEDVLYISEEAFERFKFKFGVPQSGDILITAVGTLANIFRVRKGQTFYFKDGNLIWMREVSVSSLFLEILLKFNKPAILRSAIGSSQKALTIFELNKLKLALPILPEQTKIAAFLGVVDEKLAALRARRAGLETYKRGLMQKLFSRTLRFTKPDGSAFPDWEEKQLGEVFTWHKTNSLSRENLNYEAGDVQNIHYGDIHTKFKASFRQTEETVPFVSDGAAPKGFAKDEFCQIGDVVIADASEDYADIGKAIEVVELSDTPLVAGLHTYIARPRGQLVTGFSGYMLRSADMRKEIMTIAQGVSVLGISKTNLEKLRLHLPHPEEQTLIANALQAMDAKIQAVSDQITRMEGFKKGLLQQMFV